MPALPPYPEGADWHVLPPKIAAALLDLRNEVNEAKRSIRITTEVVDPSEAADTASRSYVLVGYMALRISKRLRKYYGFGSYQAAERSSFAHELEEHYRKTHQGPFRRLWSSLPVYRIRSRIRKAGLRVMKALRSRIARPRPPDSKNGS